MTADLAWQKRYRLDRELGRPRGFVPAAPLLAHLDNLVHTTGLSYSALARAAGIAPNVVSMWRHNTRATARRSTAARIRALTPARALAASTPRGFVGKTGVVRRIQALLALGHRHADITAALARHGCAHRSHVVVFQRGQWVSAATFAAVCAAYDELSMIPGPSALTRDRARAAGYAPPLAWDDATIDDPDAVPALGHGTAAHLDLDEWAHLVRGGIAPATAASRCGVGIAAVERAALRHQRHDVLRLIQTTRSAA